MRNAIGAVEFLCLFRDHRRILFVTPAP